MRPARASYTVRAMADSSFDIVSKVDHQEVDNALNQTAKEISQRFDFKNVGAAIKWSGEAIRMEANSEERVKAILDVFKAKLIKRGISLKSLKKGDPTLSGKEYYLVCEIEQGISTENAKKVSKLIRDEGPEVGQGADPGRRAAGQLEEPRRPAGRAGAGQGQPTSTSRCSSSTTAEPRTLPRL